MTEEYTKAKAVENTTWSCSICDDEVEYCHECEEGLDEDSDYWCDRFGEHLCKECYKKKLEDKAK